jgi:signal transduction histidine kinase
LIPLVLALVAVLSIIWTNMEITRSLVVEKSSDEISQGVFELSLALDQYLRLPEERPKAQFRSLFRSLGEKLGRIEVRTEQERDRVNHMRQSHQAMGELFLMLEREFGRRDKDSVELRERIIAQLLANSRDIVSHTWGLSRISSAGLNAAQARGQNIILLTILISALALVGLAYRIGRSILTPLNRLREATETISSGDLRFQVPEAGQDETSRLARAFNEMARKLSGSYVSLKALQDEIAERRRAEESLQQRTLELQHLTETLEERVRERTAEMADLSKELVSAQEKERKRVSYVLHDNVWQSLVAIRFGIESLFSSEDGLSGRDFKNKARMIMNDLLEAVGKIRSMQGDLWPYVLDDIGILATIDWYCREFEKLHPEISIKKTVELAENEIPAAIKIIIYRILQETLNNVAQHSRATHVGLSLDRTDRRISLTVEDDGLGFDPEEMIARRSPWAGLGLLSIKARTEFSGGTFVVESVRGQGTRVRATWDI